MFPVDYEMVKLVMAQRERDIKHAVLTSGARRQSLSSRARTLIKRARQ